MLAVLGVQTHGAPGAASTGGRGAGRGRGFQGHIKLHCPNKHMWGTSARCTAARGTAPTHVVLDGSDFPPSANAHLVTAAQRF